MIVDTLFQVFAPTKEWEEEFERSRYDLDATNKKCGSPYVSSQDEVVKIMDGVYMTELSPSYLFDKTGLECVENHSDYYEYREEQKLKGLSDWTIRDMYTREMYGSVNHVEYGICDNPEQILHKWPHLMQSKQRHFITMTPMHRKEQPECDGFRFHKWGEYIGVQNPQNEYLYDEVDIDMVYVFHIHTLMPSSSLGMIIHPNLV